MWLTPNKRGNPIFAVLLTWVVAVGLILAGGFEYLLNLSAMFYVVLYVAVMFGVFMLRRKEPETERPYRAWGHPYTTVLCIIGWTLITVGVVAGCGKGVGGLLVAVKVSGKLGPPCGSDLLSWLITSRESPFAQTG